MQAKCLPTTTILYSICTRARTKYNGRSVVGVNIWNSNWEQENSIRWMDFVNSHRPAFYKCCKISMLNENGSVLHTETHMHGHGSNRLSCDSATVTVIVKHSMLADRHDNTVEGLFCSSSRTQLNTTKNLPMKWIPQKNTVPRLARCRKLCHQLNSISMQRNIYR